MKTKHVLIAVAAVLAILLLLSGWWGMQQKSEKEALISEKSKLEEELTGLNEIRDDLLTEVDSLQEAYFSLAEENESLKGSLDKAQKEVAARKAALTNIKRSSATEVNDLKVQIQELLAVKSELEQSISVVQSQNDSLRMVANMLQEDLDLSRQENEDLNNLNQTIQEEIKQLTLANFKASAFQVEVGQKNSKLTSKSRRARNIAVNFDLANVPEKYQGVRPIYLAVTDDKGTPIKATNPIETQVTVNGSAMDLIAIEGKEVNIGESQRLSFQHDLAEKLPAGFYRAAVYTDIGLLGATSFRLR